MVISLTACDFAANWRDRQVKESHDLVGAGKVLVPPSPPAQAADLADDLPVDASWQVYQYSDSGGTVRASLISTASPAQTVEWIDARLRERGYESGDNISRMLEGVTYSGKGKYGQIYVQVTLNTSDQVLVTVAGSN